MSEKLVPEYTFNNFIEGNSNRIAASAALAVSESSVPKYNPFYIWGKSGLGKTHLLHAIGNATKQNFPSKKVKYVPAETFMNDFTNALSSKKLNSFDTLYRNVDVLLMDDIQFFTEGRKEQTIEKFFHIFNSLYMNKKQIVLTSDQRPMQLNNIDERLKSRFASGLSLEIEAPEYETRLAILTYKTKAENIEITPEINEVLEYIAECITRNVRELEGILQQILVKISLSNESVSIDFVKPLVKDYISNNENSISIQKILICVANYFSISPEDILGTSREQKYAYPRQITMFLSKKLTDKSYPKIANELGGKDHSTVMASERKINKELSNNNRQVYYDVEEIRSMIGK